MTKYYYDKKTNKYVVLHRVTPKNIPAGYIEISEKEYNNQHFAQEFDEYDYGEDEGEVVGLK